MQKFPENWDLKTKIEFLQRKIILNSIAYYEFNTNFLSDMYYDSICRQLVKLQEEYGDVSDTQYGYVMYDFDGSTGFDLMYRLNESDKEFLMNNVKHHIKGAGPEVWKKERKKVEEKRSDKEPETKSELKPFLYDYQMDAVKRMKNGCILNGGVGSGKSRTSLFYYFKENGGWIDREGYTPPKHKPKDLIIITTAQKRNLGEWEEELGPYLLYPDKETKLTVYGNKVLIDSWNNIGKYSDITNAFFIFDEDRVTGKGVWVKHFLKIAKNNQWIILSATPGDSWPEYEAVFLANGFFRTKSEFRNEHLIYTNYAGFPQLKGYRNETRLIRLRDNILVDMDCQRTTIPHHEDVFCSYDISKYKEAMRNRWDPYKDEPIQQASGLCYVLRRIVNTDESRQVAVLELLEKHPRAIIFYNHDHELDILKNIAYPEGTKIAEYNGHVHDALPEGDKWVYLVNYAAGNAGWNCIKTNCIIFYSQNYSYKIMQQSAGRIDRLNTPYNDLYYYHLRSRSGIDLAISKALSQKKKFNERKFAGFDK